jgi:phage shock protein E
MPLRRRVVLLAVLLPVISACSTIGGAEAKTLVQGGALLLDVRTPEEFAEGHLAGAVNIPVDALPGRLAEVEPKDRPVVVYCRSGARSKRARGLLLEHGWVKVENLGGMGNWPKE